MPTLPNSDDSKEIARIRKRSKEQLYSDVWYCPHCGDGEMVSADENYDACEEGDRVACQECGHECALEDILFIRGDIDELLKEVDRLRRLVASKQGLLKPLLT